MASPFAYRFHQALPSFDCKLFAADEWSFIWQTESSTTVVTLSFDTVTESGEDEFPYQAPISIGGGFARWDPFLNRMVLFIGTAGAFEQLGFAFDGEDLVEGCIYRSQDAGYFGPLPSFDHVLYGPCDPTIGGRESPKYRPQRLLRIAHDARLGSTSARRSRST